MTPHSESRPPENSDTASTASPAGPGGAAGLAGRGCRVQRSPVRKPSVAGHGACSHAAGSATGTSTRRSRVQASGLLRRGTTRSAQYTPAANRSSSPPLVPGRQPSKNAGVNSIVSAPLPGAQSSSNWPGSAGASNGAVLIQKRASRRSLLLQHFERLVDGLQRVLDDLPALGAVPVDVQRVAGKPQGDEALDHPLEVFLGALGFRRVGDPR